MAFVYQLAHRNSRVVEDQSVCLAEKCYCCHWRNVVLLCHNNKKRNKSVCRVPSAADAFVLPMSPSVWATAESAFWLRSPVWTRKPLPKDVRNSKTTSKRVLPNGYVCPVAGASPGKKRPGFSPDPHGTRRTGNRRRSHDPPKVGRKQSPSSGTTAA